MELVVRNEEIDERAALVVDILTAKGWTISFAESCTAGLAALVLPAFRLLPDAHAAYSLRDRYAYFRLETLVRWKIRLND